MACSPDAVRALVPTLLRVGLNENVEFRIENTYTRTTETSATQGTARAEGNAPVSVGVKVHFIDADGRQQPSVGVIARFFPRSGTRDFQSTRATGDFKACCGLGSFLFGATSPAPGRYLIAQDGFAQGLRHVRYNVSRARPSPSPSAGRVAVPVCLGCSGRSLRA